MPVTVNPPANEDLDRLPTDPGRWAALMLAAAGVGVLVGLLGVGFRLAIACLVNWRFDVLGVARDHVPTALAWTLPVAFGAVGAGVGVWLSRRFAPEAAGSGLPRVEAVLQQHERPAGLNVLVVKFVGGALAIGSGLALGREGPTVQMGAIVGRLSSDRLKRLVGEPWTLMAAGAGAGLAVAFNAPLAAVIFVSEELLRRFSVRSISATLVATVCGTVVLRELLGSAPDFGVAALPETPMRVLPGFLLLGLAAGLLGVAFNATLLTTMNLFDRARSWPRGTTGALVGAGAGLLAWFHPFGVGGGENLVQDALNTVNGQQLWPALLIAVRRALCPDHGLLRLRRARRHLRPAAGARGTARRGLCRAGPVGDRIRHPRGRVRDRRDGRLLHGGCPRPADRRRPAAGDDRQLDPDRANDGRLNHGLRRAGTAGQPADLRRIA